MEHKLLLLTVGLHKYGVKNKSWRKWKNIFFEALFKLKIHKIKTLHLGKSFPPELSFGVKLGNRLFLHWHFLPGTTWGKITLWCYTDPVWAASTKFGEHQVVLRVLLNWAMHKYIATDIVPALHFIRSNLNVRMWYDCVWLWVITQPFCAPSFPTYRTEAIIFPSLTLAVRGFILLNIRLWKTILVQILFLFTFFQVIDAFGHCISILKTQDLLMAFISYMCHINALTDEQRSENDMVLQNGSKLLLL